MDAEKQRRFEMELEKRANKVQEYILSKVDEGAFAPAEIKEAICDYFYRGGKKLRPGVLLFSCGAVGGDERYALPAAAAVEAFHTWTLVHDDIIDRDNKRRGKFTVHHKFFKKALENTDIHFELKEAKHYGLSVGILAGDVQHGWSISLLTELSTKFKVNPYVAIFLIKNLDSYVLNTLVEGEMLDILYSKQSIESLDEDLIIQMLCKKTGALYEFAGHRQPGCS